MAKCALCRSVQIATRRGSPLRVRAMHDLYTYALSAERQHGVHLGTAPPAFDLLARSAKHREIGAACWYILKTTLRFALPAANENRNGRCSIRFALGSVCPEKGRIGHLWPHYRRILGACMLKIARTIDSAQFIEKPSALRPSWNACAEPGRIRECLCGSSIRTCTLAKPSADQ
jgi:hypothetical protein